MSTRFLTIVFWLGIFLLLVPALIHAYLLMPFPGSQDLEAIWFVYYLEKIVLPSRIIGFLLVAWPLWKTFTQGNWQQKTIQGSVLLLCLGLFYFTDWMYKAERMFEEPGIVRFADAAHNQVPDTLLVIGVIEGNVAKAYPVNYLGYHHKVQDSVGTTPVLVTYCTMCRTGRVYSPVINGKYQAFRLVGARHYNAVIEDPDTKSWWYQATGEAAAGPLKGKMLQEINAEQLSLRSWLEKYPHSLVLQPDSTYAQDYDGLKRYDRLQPIDRDSTLSPDTLIRKSWVVGVDIQGKAKAYDWKQLQKHQLVNDTIGQIPVVVMIEKDSLSFHVWNRKVNNETFVFTLDSVRSGLRDTGTYSLWNAKGECIEGTFEGKQLTKIQAYQEYWHSWKFFHPSTTFWGSEKKMNSLVKK
jgi:hypothetical protein